MDAKKKERRRSDNIVDVCGNEFFFSIDGELENGGLFQWDLVTQFFFSFFSSDCNSFIGYKFMMSDGGE